MTEADTNAIATKLGLSDRTKLLSAGKIEEAFATEALESAEAKETSQAILEDKVKLKQIATTKLFKLANIALSSVIVLGVGLAINAYNNWKQKQEELKEQISETAKAAQEENKEISDLYMKYVQANKAVNEGTGSKEDLASATDELLKALGHEGTAVDGLIEKYGDLDTAISNVTYDSLVSNNSDLMAGYQNASNDFVKKMKELTGSGSELVGYAARGDQDYLKYLTDHGFNTQLVDSNSRAFKLVFEPVVDEESARKAYEQLQSMKELFDNDFKNMPSGMVSSDLYNKIIAYAEKASESFGELDDSVNAYNDNIVRQTIIKIRGEQGVLGALKDVVQGVKNALGGEGILIGDIGDDQITSIIENTPEYQSSVAEMADGTDRFSNKLSKAKEGIEKYSSAVSSMQSAYEKFVNSTSTMDKLSAILEINESAKELGKDFNWEILDGMPEERQLIVLQEAINMASNAHAENIIEELGIDKDGVLANIIEDTIRLTAEFNKMNDAIDNIQASYQTVKDVLDSYNDTGNITIDQLQSLLTADENYIRMLEVKNNKLVINEQAYRDLLEVQMLEFKNKLESAAASEIEALAKEKSKIATENHAKASSDAVAEIEKETEAVKENTKTILANEAAKNARDAGVSEDEINAILDKYNKIWNAYSNTNLDTNLGKGKSSSSSTDAWLQEYKDKMSQLKDQREKELISEVQFYVSSEVLMNNYLKDTSAHIKKYQSEISDAEKDLHGSWINSYQEERDQLSRSYENGTISTINYYNALKSLQEKYYGAGVAAEKYGRYTKEAAEATRELADVANTIFSNAISGATTLLDKQIDKYEKLKEAAQKSYDAQIDAIDTQKENLQDQIDSLDKQIKSIDKTVKTKQKELDTIKKINEEKQRELDLQKAQYIFEQAQNNRTKSTYRNGQMVYEVDDSAVKDAKKSVDDAKEEIRLAALQKELDLLEERKEVIEEQKELVQEQMDALSKQQEAIQKLLDQSNEYFDGLIESLNGYKDKWSELTNMNEQAKSMAELENVLNKMGLTSEQVAQMSDDAFEKFKDSYIANMAQAQAGTKTFGQAIQDIMTLNGFGNLTDSILNAIDVTEELGNATQSTLGNATNATDILTSSMTSTATATTIATGEIDKLKAAVDSLPTEKKITIKIETSGSMPSFGTSGRYAEYGTAHVEGTAKVEGDWGVQQGGKSLVGELGRELIVRNGRFFTVGENGAEMFDLQKGDIVFNNRQAEELLSKGSISSRGKAYVNGSLINDDIKKTANSSLLSSINTSKFRLPSVLSNLQAMMQGGVVSSTGNSNATYVTQEINVTMPNITNESSGARILSELNSLSAKKLQFFNKKK